MQYISWFKKVLADFGLEYFNRYYGLYRGKIDDNEDPKFYGRMKLIIPQVHGATAYDYWAWPKGAFAGKNIGFYALPNEGDPVWVSFENGDPRFPVWEYGWYGKGDTPELAKQRNVYLFQTTKGQRIYFNDNDEYIRIANPDGTTVEINKGHISLGSEKESAEPGVLGNKNADMLNALLDIVESINSYCQLYAGAQIATATNIPIYAPMIANWTNMLNSTIQTLIKINGERPKVDLTKSKIVSLD